jgi:hypothetical protein
MPIPRPGPKPIRCDDCRELVPLGDIREHSAWNICTQCLAEGYDPPDLFEIRARAASLDRERARAANAILNPPR